MENLDVTVLRTLRDWRMAGRRALLATVVRTWGSSPRPVGSIMALADDGAMVGSVSGGCIEDDLISRYSGPVHDAGSATRVSKMPEGAPTLVQYGVSADEAQRFGLPCGGTLELLLEYAPDAESLSALVSELEGGRLMQRSVSLSDGTAHLKVAETPAALHVDAESLTNTFGPEYRMLIIGAGQLSEYLSTMAKFSGFAVTLCDPRIEHRSSWAVPGVAITTEMPDDAVISFRPDRRSCVVALTHDPKLDDLALLEALASDAFYVGAIGSRRNAASRRQRMMEHFGQTDESLARLRGPIGVYIGSKTPPEIAVSVMAEVLAVKNNVVLPREIEVAIAKEAVGRIAV
ncbi:XdhC family protein [Variovorax sp. RHLX14]|uniref:XdhC family protein n=1 Tax=Variovorax sp. RHLX14 TaxID=1259731 RepID=UPI003F4859A2